MTKRFSVFSTEFNKYSVWDNKTNGRTAMHTKDFSEEQINDYVNQLNAKYKSN